MFAVIESGALLAQDTIYYDRLYNKNVGETIEIAYKSRSTGNWEKDYLPNGKWQSLDSNGNVLVETNFRYNRRRKNTKKDGLQVFFDPKTGDTLLMRQFSRGRLIQQLGLQSTILVVDNDVLHIYKDFGSYTIAE